jgi:glutamate-5-semialdehyde dehydrogenase
MTVQSKHRHRDPPDTSITSIMDELGRAARQASQSLANCSAAKRNAALLASASEIRSQADAILSANRRDLNRAKDKELGQAMLDRLALDAARLEAIASGLEAVAELPDPLGRVLAEWVRPNGLRIQRVSVPLGVIGMIYESRPNVTADAAGLCLKSGNPVILRGGSESFESSRAIYECVVASLRKVGISAAAVQMVPTTNRAAVGYMLSSMRSYIDVLVPRGGKSLIRRVQEDASVPVIGHLEGICHVYLHESANADMATDIVLNSKMRRTGICGAAETLLVDRNAVTRLMPRVVRELVEAGCEVRGDVDIQQISSAVLPANEQDWTTEYLDAVISVRTVDGVGDAIDHIRTYGSGHTECIVADEEAAAESFLTAIDSAILVHNASTQFADGGEFGMGAEIGIATGKIHARGPVGAEQLTSYKYLVRGAGQVRS